jgi:hypothetical protein
VNFAQVVMQARWLASRAVWDTGAAEPVLAWCAIIAGPDDPGLTDFSTPFACIHPNGEEADEEDPKLTISSFSLVVVQAVEGQDMSQAALMGGPRAGGPGSSRGRGAIEIRAELLKTLAAMTGANGCRASVVYRSSPSAAVANGRSVVAVEATMQAYTTVAQHYDPPLFLVGTGGSGSVSLAWTNAPTRWDQYTGAKHDGQRLAPIIRYASGATAPTTATSGTGVTGIDAGETTATVTLAAGTYSFAIFQPYTETGANDPERYSSQELSTTSLSVVVS